MARVLVLTGGPDHAHDFSASGAALAWTITGGGHEVEVVDDPDTAAGRLGNGDVDALAINALRWRMLDPKYEPWRDRWEYHTPESTRATIGGFVAAGGGLFGSHTASICFDDWPGWRDVLGGAWDWERSSHPPPGPVTAHVTRSEHRDHPVVAGLPSEFHLTDEVYGDLDLRDDVARLVHARRTPEDQLQPIVWAHHHGEGRVVYDALGHDARSIDQQHHTALIRRAIAWITREAPCDP